ncbi:MAG: NAD-dependent epimerase/dehydratase family protein [Arcticibacter sp.]
MVKTIHAKIWGLSPFVHEKEALAELTDLTRDLIEIYDQDGRLDENPFTPTTKRTLSVPQMELQDMLAGSVCLVTGYGCVGQCLVEKLDAFGIKLIVVVDMKPAPGGGLLNDNVRYVQADVSNEQDLESLFELYRPEFIFHTAAQRDPGWAETHVRETVVANILGTWNLIKTCERYSFVKQCTFSSTGKASRYYTEEVYAATKKVCEYILDTYARRSHVRYSMVRFTHILENSLMNMGFRDAVDAAYLSVHSPGKYVTAQNVSEAGDLLLNALVSSSEGQCRFSLVRHLEWPVESLEVALFYIKQRGSRIPVIFQGNPKGYCEKFFRGQLDWSDPGDLNLLINVYECKTRSVNTEGDIVISQLPPADPGALFALLRTLETLGGEQETRDILLSGLREITQSALREVDPIDTVRILKWGLQPEHLSAEGSSVSDFNAITSLLKETLSGSPLMEELKALNYAF